MLKGSWLWSLLPNGSCITTLSTNYFCDDILAALVGSNTCWVKKLSSTRHKNVWSSTLVLCSVSHLIFPWLKSPIIIQSPLLTSLIALCIFSLFCLVMLGKRYTTPMVTVVCPVTDVHHMASLQSTSSCNCTSYAEGGNGTWSEENIIILRQRSWKTTRHQRYSGALRQGTSRWS